MSIPVQPVILTPSEPYFDRALALPFSARIYDSVGNMTAQALDYRVNGGAWTAASGGWYVGYVPDDPGPGGAQSFVVYWTIPAATFAATNVVDLRYTYTASDPSDPFGIVSPQAFTTVIASSVPATPTITSPANLSTITVKRQTVVWTTTGTQEAYEIEVRTATGGGGTQVYFFTETRPDTTAVVTIDTTGVTRYIRVRYKRLGLWSAWAQAQVTVAFVVPATPTISYVQSGTDGLGNVLPVTHIVVFTFTNPAPTGGQPTVTSMLLEYRKSGSSNPWISQGAVPLAGPYRWRPPAGTWEVRLTSTASSNGTSSTSAVTANIVVTLRGVVLHLAATPTTAMLMTLNDDGAEEEYDVESALLQYAGRAYPVVEFGTATSDTVDVGTVTLKTRAELDQLLAFVTARAVVCYRDKRERKVYGPLKVSKISDKFYGYEIGLSITRVDYTSPEISAN